MPVSAGLLYYERRWSERWSSTLGYSQVHQRNTAGQAGSAFRTGQYASINLVHHAARNLMVGGEVLQGRRTVRSGASADDTRVQVSVRYSF